MDRDDTIVAIATPPGRGGIGLIRISGPQALAIARGLLGGRALRPRHATLAPIQDGAGEVLDQVVATWFPGPHSYTTEDVVEISAHGSPVVLATLLQLGCTRGARLADPGEFTRRAFLGGRIDLAQAEAVHDLIDAHTLFQARTAARQLHGSVARMLRPVHEGLVQLIARLEAGIDFADDDVPIADNARIAAAIEPLAEELERLEKTFQQGRTIREGLTLAILGRPNVGKSSLFNCLLGTDRAIVTAQAGTTRDTIAESLNLDGIPVRLMDTAGIRVAEGEAERMGIQRSWEAVADADLVLGVFDLSQPPGGEDRGLWARMRELPHFLAVMNKRDLESAIDPATWWKEMGADAIALHSVSARTGAGMAELRRAIFEAAVPDLAGNADFITQARHARQLGLAGAALRMAEAAVEGSLPHEALLVDLYESLHELGAITGQTTVEDILGVIFSTFCIGK